MKGTALIITTLLCLSNGCFGQTNSNHNIVCQKFFLLYQIGDSPQITENWKLEKKESVNIDEFRRIQSDAYGELSSPNRFTYKHSYSYTDKDTRLEAEFDSVFTDNFKSVLYLNLYKGKKKKSNYLIENINIISRGDSSNLFIDSLCAPYIKLIQNKQTDTILNLLFPQSKFDELVAKINEIKSKKKRQKALMSLGFIKMSGEMIKEQLDSIDSDAEYKYISSQLRFQKKIPTLTVSYMFTNTENKAVQMNINFRLEKNKYEMTNLGFQKIET